MITQILERLTHEIHGLRFEGGVGEDVKGQRIHTLMRDIPEIIKDEVYSKDDTAGKLGEDFIVDVGKNIRLVLQCKTAQSGIQYKDARRIAGRSLLYRYSIQNGRTKNEISDVKRVNLRIIVILDGVAYGREDTRRTIWNT